MIAVNANAGLREYGVQTRRVQTVRRLRATDVGRRATQETHGRRRRLRQILHISYCEFLNGVDARPDFDTGGAAYAAARKVWSLLPTALPSEFSRLAWRSLCALCHRHRGQAVGAHTGPGQ